MLSVDFVYAWLALHLSVLKVVFNFSTESYLSAAAAMAKGQAKGRLASFCCQCMCVCVCYAWKIKTGVGDCRTGPQWEKCPRRSGWRVYSWCLTTSVSARPAALWRHATHQLCGTTSMQVSQLLVSLVLCTAQSESVLSRTRVWYC